VPDNSNAVSQNLDGHVFRFVGKAPGFDLELRFRNGNSLNRAEILKALKAAFDAVKNETVDI